MTIGRPVTSKELALRASEGLPDDADIDEIIEEIVVYRTLQERLDRIDSERLYALDEVKRRMAEWRR